MASFDYDVSDHRLRLRRERRRAPCRGEGLPGRRHGVRQALEGRGHPEDPVGPGRTSCGSPPPSSTGSRGSSTSTTCSSSPAPASAAARTSMRARCTSHRSSSSTRRNGPASPTGPTSWRRTSTRRRGCSASSATRTCPRTSTGRMQAGRERHGPRGDSQQGPGRRLLRQPGSRGRRSVLRRGRTAAHRLHLVRQLQHRLRPQRQEQADDELPLPGREARRPGPRACTRCTTSSRSTEAGSRCTRVTPAGRSAQRTSTTHVHRRAGDRGRPRVRVGQAPASHAAQGPADRPVERARETGADELRTAALRSRGPTGSGSATRRRSTSCRGRSRSPRASGRIR